MEIIKIHHYPFMHEVDSQHHINSKDYHKFSSQEIPPSTTPTYNHIFRHFKIEKKLILEISVNEF